MDGVDGVDGGAEEAEDGNQELGLEGHTPGERTSDDTVGPFFFSFSQLGIITLCCRREPGCDAVTDTAVT